MLYLQFVDSFSEATPAWHNGGSGTFSGERFVRVQPFVTEGTGGAVVTTSISSVDTGVASSQPRASDQVIQSSLFCRGRKPIVDVFRSQARSELSGKAQKTPALRSSSFGSKFCMDARYVSSGA